MRFSGSGWGYECELGTAIFEPMGEGRAARVGLVTAQTEALFPIWSIEKIKQMQKTIDWEGKDASAVRKRMERRGGVVFVRTGRHKAVPYLPPASKAECVGWHEATGHLGARRLAKYILTQRYAKGLLRELKLVQRECGFCIRWAARNGVDKRRAVGTPSSEKVYRPMWELRIDIFACFASSVFHDWHDRVGIQVVHGAPLNPESQGHVESQMKALARALGPEGVLDRTMLPIYAGIYNRTALHQSVTPFAAMFGRDEAPQMWDVLGTEMSGEGHDIAKWLADVALWRVEVEDAKNGVLTAREKELRERYTPSEYRPGDRVWAWLERSDGKDKLSRWRNWRAMRVTRVTGPSTVELIDEETGRSCKRAARLLMPRVVAHKDEAHEREVLERARVVVETRRQGMEARARDYSEAWDSDDDDSDSDDDDMEWRESAEDSDASAPPRGGALAAQEESEVQPGSDESGEPVSDPKALYKWHRRAAQGGDLPVLGPRVRRPPSKLDC
jgi:hypothetical protein